MGLLIVIRLSACFAGASPPPGVPVEGGNEAGADGIAICCVMYDGIGCEDIAANI